MNRREFGIVVGSALPPMLPWPESDAPSPQSKADDRFRDDHKLLPDETIDIWDSVAGEWKPKHYSAARKGDVIRLSVDGGNLGRNYGQVECDPFADPETGAITLRVKLPEARPLPKVTPEQEKLRAQIREYAEAYWQGDR
jgi:hypothetical protein